jgi:hypothetical protein
VPPLELGEQRLVRLAQHVREHVEPPAVRHPDHDLLGAGGRAARDRLVEHRDERVGALDAEALLPLVGEAEEALEPVDLGEPASTPLLVGGERPRHLLARSVARNHSRSSSVERCVYSMPSVLE